MEPKSAGHGTAQTSKADSKATITGLTAGTTVLTLDGEIPVEFLSPGDRVITRDSGMAVLKQIRIRRVRTRAVSVAASSLGHDRPAADLVLPQGQQVLVRDWRAQALFGKQQAMVPVSRLVDGQYVRHIGEVEMRVFELRFERDHVIYAGGMEVAAPVPASEPA